jgi:broad specificity phosphatase PhoE
MSISRSRSLSFPATTPRSNDHGVGARASWAEPYEFSLEKRISEIDLGKWDGLTHKQARALDPVFYDARPRQMELSRPGGESYADVTDRAESWAKASSQHVRG